MAAGTSAAVTFLTVLYGSANAQHAPSFESNSSTVETASDPAIEPVAEAPAPSPPASNTTMKHNASLSAGTPVYVMLNDEISTITSRVGDQFGVTVLYDVVDYNYVVIPAGTTGYGEVTFSTNKGAFGKPGILGISLRRLTLGDRQVALDGRYREEGQNKNGATAATWLAVGVFSGFIKGKPGVIPKGRELKGRTGEVIDYSIPPISVTTPDVSVLTTLPGAAPASAQPPVAAMPEADPF